MLKVFYWDELSPFSSCLVDDRTKMGKCLLATITKCRVIRYTSSNGFFGYVSSKQKIEKDYLHLLFPLKKGSWRMCWLWKLLWWKCNQVKFHPNHALFQELITLKVLLWWDKSRKSLYWLMCTIPNGMGYLPRVLWTISTFRS